MSALAIITKINRLRKIRADREKEQSRAKTLPTRKRSDGARKDFTAYANDFPGFARLLLIDTKDGQRRRFRPNAIQSAFEISRSENGRDIVLKPRQVGLTTYELARDAWYFLTKPSRKVRVVCQSATENGPINDMSAKLTLMFSSLEDQGFEIPFVKRTATRWTLANGAELRIIVAGASKAAASKKGRGGTVHRLHITELAYFEQAQATMNAIEESLAGGDDTELVIESTANGAAGVFFEKYKDAKDGKTSLKAHFFRWLDQIEYATPLEPGETITPETEAERQLVNVHGGTLEQLKWYRAKVQDKKDQALVDQEYPIDEETCWLTPGRLYFLREQTRKLLARCIEPIRVVDVDTPSAVGKILVWKDPLPNTAYLWVADPSEGELVDPNAKDPDPSAAHCYCRDTGEHVASIHGQISMHELARLLAEEGARYNNALVAVERNNHGHAVLLALTHVRQYENLYVDDDGKFGWMNSPVSRVRALESMKDSHASETWWSPDRDSLAEMLLFIVSRKGKPQAGPGAHDDRVIAHAIGHDIMSRVDTIELPDDDYENAFPKLRV